MPTIRVPIPYRRYTDGRSNIAVDGLTAGAAIDDLVRRYPELRQQLFDSNGELVKSTHESVNVLLGKHDIRELQGPQTPLQESDQLIILRTWPAAISGGQQFNQ